MPEISEDEMALRRAVGDRPNEATPRLVLADYLDDTGHPEKINEAARIRDAYQSGGRAFEVFRQSGDAFDKTLKLNSNLVTRQHAMAAEYHAADSVHHPDKNRRQRALANLAGLHDDYIVIHGHDAALRPAKAKKAREAIQAHRAARDAVESLLSSGSR